MCLEKVGQGIYMLQSLHMIWINHPRNPVYATQPDTRSNSQQRHHLCKSIRHHHSRRTGYPSHGTSSIKPLPTDRKYNMFIQISGCPHSTSPRREWRLGNWVLFWNYQNSRRKWRQRDFYIYFTPYHRCCRTQDCQHHHRKQRELYYHRISLLLHLCPRHHCYCRRHTPRLCWTHTC